MSKETDELNRRVEKLQIALILLLNQLRESYVLEEGWVARAIDPKVLDTIEKIINS